jgi:NAD(P)H dehydrogenase (quinone)
MSIVITGATGNLGRLVIEELLARGQRVAGVVRDAEKAADLATRGVELRVADYERPETLHETFRHGERALLISSNAMGRNVAHHAAVIEAAGAAGVELLAYTSVLGGPKATFAIAEPHIATERILGESGLSNVLLRNGWYNENYTGALPLTLKTGAVVGCSGNGRVATASRADYAAAAATILAGDGHEGAAYELSGDTAWTLEEYAAEVSRQTGRDIAYKDLSADEYVKLMVDAGVDDASARPVADADLAIARGELAATPGELSRLIGRPTTTIAESVATALHNLDA